MVYTDLFLQPPSKRIDPAGNTDDFTYYHVDRMPLAGVCLFVDQDVVDLSLLFRAGRNKYPAKERIGLFRFRQKANPHFV